MLILKPADFGIDFIGAFFSQVIQADRFRIQRVSIKKPGAKTVSISGYADYLGYSKVNVELTFAEKNDQVVISLDGTFEERNKVVQLPLLNWLTARNIGVTTTFSQPYNLISFNFHANIGLADDMRVKIPIIITPLANGNWQMEAANGAPQRINVKKLVKLLGGKKLASILPMALKGIQINDLGTIFSPISKTIDYFSIGVKVKNGWDLMPKISLKPGLQLILTRIKPSSLTSHEFVGIVKGTFDIAKVTVPVFVQAQAGSDSTLWMIGLDPENNKSVELPSLSGLLELANDPNLKEALPNGLHDLPGITLFKLEADFTTSPATTLQRLSFGARTESSWEVIENFLTVERLSFEIDLFDLTDTENRQVGAHLTSTLSFGKSNDAAWLYFIAEKNIQDTDWKLSGGLPRGKSLNLTALVDKLLKRFVTIPKSTPKISFDTVETTVIPGKTMTLTAGSSSPWTLVKDKLVINQLKLEFEYSKDKEAEKKPLFSGSLETDLKIANVNIHLLAKLNQSEKWTFDGRTEPNTPVKIGDLISDLGRIFKIAVPNSIGHFNLQNIQLSFESGAGPQDPAAHFNFACTGHFTIAEQDLTASVHIDLTRQKTGRYEPNISGTLTIPKGSGKEIFKLNLSGDAQDSKTSGEWSASPGQALTIADMADAFGGASLTELPSSLQTLSLSNVFLTYDFTKKTLLIALTIDQGNGKTETQVGQALFVSSPLKSQRVYIFGLAIPGITLANLPLVGDQLPDAQHLGISDAGIWALSQSPINKPDDVKMINDIIEQAEKAEQAKTYPKLPADGVNSKMLFYGKLQCGGDASIPLTLAPEASPPATVPDQGQPAASVTTTLTAPSDSTKWFNVQKQFGIFQFKRIGAQYHDEKLRFALDAAIQAGPLTFSMDGLSMCSPLTHFEPTFDLSGLGLSYASGPIEMGGALLKLPGAQLAPHEAFQFDGTIVLKAENFSLAAIGSYAQSLNGTPSLFVFALLEEAFGGPPACFVTGLMAGFGFNRALQMPAQDEIQSFPLLEKLSSVSEKPKPMDVLDVLEGRSGEKLKQWISPQPGESWLAVGLEFTSFELVHTQALLVAEFGTDFQLALLGLSTMQLPQPEENSPTYAYVQMQLRAVFKPQEGYIAATAILSSGSYVLTKACHLTGGFAFSLWFGPNAHAGEFVITLGGYHPAFKPPAHFPTVPRLGFNWVVSDTVSITGDAYFALTTSCIMAGGGLDVQFHDGDLRAWFTAHADTLVSWRPFFFVADIAVSIGVSYRLDLLVCTKTITVSLGADLDLWGPPTGGEAHIHLVAISFTVGFGADHAGTARAALEWEDFKSLLPAPDTVCRITVNGGLYKTLDGAGNSGKKWIVRANEFSFSTQSAIPVSHLQYGDTPSTASIAASTPSIAIRPMNQTGVTSTHKLSIYQGDSTTPIDVSSWELKPIKASVAESLWGAPPAASFTQVPNAPSANVIAGQMVGYAVQAPAPVAGHSPGPIPVGVLLEEYLKPGKAPWVTAPKASPNYVPTFDNSTVGLIQKIMGDARNDRNALYVALKKSGIYTGKNDPLIQLANTAGHLYSAAPMRQQ